jgi:hypothetical protein
MRFVHGWNRIASLQSTNYALRTDVVDSNDQLEKKEIVIASLENELQIVKRSGIEVEERVKGYEETMELRDQRIHEMDDLLQSFRGTIEEKENDRKDADGIFSISISFYPLLLVSGVQTN